MEENTSNPPKGPDYDPGDVEAEDESNTFQSNEHFEEGNEPQFGNSQPSESAPGGPGPGGPGLGPDVITPINPPERADDNKPFGGTGTNLRGPYVPQNDPPQPPEPPAPADNNGASPDSEWDFSSLRLILQSPLIWRAIPPSMIPSPLSPFTHEQVEFYLIKEHGDELYKSWLQANGEWHGIPGIPDTETADGKAGISGIKEILEGNVEEAELNTCIWAPKMVGEDVHFQDIDEQMDNQPEAWESEDTAQLRPELGPTNVFQYTVRDRNNYQKTKGIKGMTIWNGVKGGVYRFPCAARMSTERKHNETSEEYYERYDDAVDGLLRYPNDAEKYEGEAKDRGAYRASNHVVRREFAIDIRRIERKFSTPWIPDEMPEGVYKPRKRPKETIFIHDVHRKTEQAYTEDQRDGALGGTRVPNDESENLPTIDIANLYTGGDEDEPDPWVIPAERELELRAVRMDTINPNISRPTLKRPYLYNEFDDEYSKDLQGTAAYFVVNTDPRPLKINGTMLLYQGQIAGPLPSFAFFEAPGGQIAFWWGIMGTLYKPVPKIARSLGSIYRRYDLTGQSSQPDGDPPGPAAMAARIRRIYHSNTGPSVGQQQQQQQQPLPPVTITTKNPQPGIPTRDERLNAAVEREAAFRKKYARTKYRTSVGGVRYPSGSRLLNPEPAHVHIRGGSGSTSKSKSRNANTSITRTLLKRIIMHDSDGNYNFIEIMHNQDGRLTKSRQKNLTSEQAMELRNSGVPLEELPYPVGGRYSGPKKPNDHKWISSPSVGKYPRATRPNNVPATREITSRAVPRPRDTRKDLIMQASIYGFPCAARFNPSINQSGPYGITPPPQTKPNDNLPPNTVPVPPKHQFQPLPKASPLPGLPPFVPTTGVPNEFSTPIEHPPKELYNLPATSGGIDEDFDNGTMAVRPLRSTEQATTIEFDSEFEDFLEKYLPVHTWIEDEVAENEYSPIARTELVVMHPQYGYGEGEDEHAWMFRKDTWEFIGKSGDGKRVIGPAHTIGKTADLENLTRTLGLFNWLRMSDRTEWDNFGNKSWLV